MGRNKGTAIFAVNFEPTGQSCLDARLLVNTKADLIASETYQSKNFYKGMTVTVADTSEIYILVDPSKITQGDYSGWKKVDAGAAEKVTIVDNLTAGGSDKALSAEQGKVLKGLVDPLTQKLSDVTSTVGATIDQKVSAAKSAIDNYTVNGKKISTNPTLTKADVGLTNVLDVAQIPASEKGKINGVATLGNDGKVPSTQLPSYVDDVIEFQKVVAAKVNIPNSGLTVGWLFYATEEKKFFKAISGSAVDAGTTPEAGKIYVATADGNKQYRWGGDESGMIQITSGNLVLGETAGTAYEGSKGKKNADDIKALQAKDTELAGKITEGDSQTLNSAKEYTNTEIGKITAKGAKYYHTSATEGNSVSIPAATHECGTFPNVSCYVEEELVEAAVSIKATGDITVSWNGTVKKIDIIVIGK